MTREEAIKLIDTHTVCFYNEIDSPTLQALHLAIEALKADVARWSSWNKTFEQSGIADLISRADAIEAVYKLLWNEPPYCDSEALCRERAKEIVNALPSADAVPFDIQLQSTREVLDQFAEDRVKVVRCKDCRWFKQDSSPVGYGYCDGRMVGREVDYNDYCSYGERQCNYFGERRGEVNGFKSVGQAWNTDQGNW